MLPVPIEEARNSWNLVADCWKPTSLWLMPHTFTVQPQYFPRKLECVTKVLCFRETSRMRKFWHTGGTDVFLVLWGKMEAQWDDCTSGCWRGSGANVHVTQCRSLHHFPSSQGRHGNAIHLYFRLHSPRLQTTAGQRQLWRHCALMSRLFEPAARAHCRQGLILQASTHLTSSPSRSHDGVQAIVLKWLVMHPCNLGSEFKVQRWYRQQSSLAVCCQTPWSVRVLTSAAFAC